MTDLNNDPFYGPLTVPQQADVDAFNKSIAMLAEAINVSGNVSAAEKYNETVFQYVPDYNEGTAIGYQEAYRDFPHVIRMTSGFAKFIREGSYNAQSYNYYFFKSGPTMSAFLLAHELGHSVLGKDEFSASNYANSLIKNYSGWDGSAYKCQGHCN